MNYIKPYTHIIIGLIILISVSLISCNPNFDPTLGTYTVSFETMEYGTAKASKTEVGYNGEVTLTATPQEGYRFVNWTVEGKEVSTKNPYTALIIRNTQFRANFEKEIYTIKVTAGEGGTAKTNKTKAEYKEKVSLSATPNEGYSFVNWTVNGEEVSTANPYTATIIANTEFKANFITHKVTVVSGEGGTAKVDKTQVAPNGKVTLTATPNDGYSFVNWTVNGEEVSKANPYTATITANTEFVANFEKFTPEYVDLGLSVKWATCNVGANSPEDYGDYFAWGETEPKDYYNWSTYKWCNGSMYTMTKYCETKGYGTVDNKTTLELTDDAARVNWGGKWRMPTRAEQDELRSSSNCTWTWTTQNGVKGYKVTSKKNGNSIFLPAAGYRDYGDLYSAGSYGYYWSSSLYAYYSNDACNVFFGSSYVDWYGYNRFHGQSVRAVCE